MRSYALTRRHLVSALFAALMLVLPAGAADLDADPPSELAALLVKKAKRAEKAGEIGEAYVYYSQASALQPRNKGYRKQAAALKLRGAAQLKSAAQKSDAPIADSTSLSAATDPVVHHALAPELMFDSLTAREVAQSRQLASPPKLSATSGRFDFDLNEAPRALFEKIAARFNLQIEFDSDYPQGGPQVRFRVNQLNYREALDAAQTATGSFVVPLSARALMVAKDTVAKRNDLEQYVTLTTSVPQVITTQELTEIVQLVRQVGSSDTKIGWDTNNDQIVIRDRVSRAALSQALLDQLFSYHPEVMIDLELLQVSNSDLLNYGFNVTSSFPLVYLSKLLNNKTNIPNGLANLLTFGGGRTVIGIAAAQVQAMFSESFSDSRSLYAARLRSGSGQSAVFHVGEKYPIITGGYLNGTSQSGSSAGFTAPPAISFEDLGLQLKATPHVHGADAVSMTIEAKYEVLTGQSAEGIPVIATNNITTDIRLRNEEWAVVGGLMNSSDSKTTSGPWGLSSIPLIGAFFRKTLTDKESSSLLIGVRPHILYIGPDENVTKTLRAGTDARPFTPL